MCELAKRITVPVSLDFMSVSSYGGDTKSSGVVKIVKDLDESLKDKDVLVVEDIVDSGRTLSYLMEMISPLNIKIYKPVELNKIKDTYRYRIMLMDKNGRALLDTVWGILDVYLKGPYSKIKIQMDPLYLE